MLLALVLAALMAGSAAAAERPAPASQVAGTSGNTLPVTGSATVNFTDLARMEAQRRLLTPAPPERALVPSELNEAESEEPATAPPAFPQSLMTPPQPNIASPSPGNSFMGLDDIAMVDSSYIVIPPDVGGGVGPTKVMDTFNNNYRIQDKTTGATLSTVGTATFWNPVVTNKALLNQLTDPRTTYDPIQGRWIVCMQTTNNPGLILFGVSVTSDPAGTWRLYSVSPGFTSSPILDFPIIGFNKNWLVVTINAYTSGGAFSRGGCMIANYPQAAAGTLSGVTPITQAAGTHFCTAPCVTLSATEDTLYLVTHLSSASATFVVDRITGTAAAPTYTSGTTTTRAGGGWVQPSGNQLPQSAPNAGVSACGATPCPIEAQDAQLRSAPTFRVDATTGRQFIYYTQSIGLPSTGQTHIGVQWTKLTASTTAPAFADGGRIEDATATSTNGGKWYAFPHIAVNSTGDWIIGYTQFSSAQHPSAGYSYHNHVDGLGTMRDPLIYKVGEDYYHKTFSTATGRNRWGDFTTAQVDPTDDQTLWVLQEYGKTRTSTDDGNTGANGSKWSTYWAAVSSNSIFTITASAGAGGTISPSGSVSVNQGANQGFTITANSCFTIADVLVDGVSQGAIASYTFSNVQASHTISASFSAIASYTITASAGANGSVTPAGASVVACGGSQTYTIAADSCYHIVSVLVDSISQGAIASYTFSNVLANHTISATFAINTYTVTASAGANGSISPNGVTTLNCAANQTCTITANSGYYLSGLLVDGSPVTPAATYTFTNVQASHTIAASFSIDGTTIAGTSTTSVLCPTNPCVTIPVTLSRSGTTPVLGYSVTFQLSPELTLCSGIASITEGTFLNASGATLFNIIDHGAGLYSADDALTANCGPTLTSGTLFSIGVSSASPGGTGTITITSLKLRDCSNAVLTAAAGPPATVPIDNQAPAVTVFNPNGGEVLAPGDAFAIIWAATDSAGVANVDIASSTDGGATYPNAIATGIANSGNFAWTVPNTLTSQARVRITAHDVNCSSASDASDATFTIANSVGVDGSGPVAFALSGVSPNPTSRGASIQFSLAREAPVRLRVLDLQGRVQAVLADGVLGAGSHRVVWGGQPGGARMRAGLYFVCYDTPAGRFVRRLAVTP